MAADEIAITLDDTDMAYIRQLVEEGAYQSLDDALKGEISRARDLRAAQHSMLIEEVERRMLLPDDQWIRIDSDTYFSDRFKEKYGITESGS